MKSLKRRGPRRTAAENALELDQAAFRSRPTDSFQSSFHIEVESRVITVVSGLPRSGTSLMMQMIVAGGIPALTDGPRTADENNPKGYFEWEPAKTLKDHPEAIAAGEG